MKDPIRDSARIIIWPGQHIFDEPLPEPLILTVELQNRSEHRILDKRWIMVQVIDGRLHISV